MALSRNAVGNFRDWLYLPYTMFGMAPRTTITKAAILSSGEVGVSAGADAFTLNNNTIAATVNSFAPVKRASLADAIGAAATEEEITTSGIAGLKMNTAGMNVSGIMPIPPRWDLRQKIRVAVVYTTAAAAVGARTITWIFTYKPLRRSTASNLLTTTKVGLDTTIAVDVPSGVAYTPEVTEFGIIGPGDLKGSQSGGFGLDFLTFNVEMDAFDAALTEDKFLLGVLFEFTERTARGLSREAEGFRRQVTNNFS